MKKLKKLAALLLAVVMTMAMNMTVFAADTQTYTLTLNGTTAGHIYEAYQIFSGDLNGSTLSNVEWGTGVDSTKTSALLDALKADDKLKATFGSVNSVKTVAEALAKASDESDVAKEFATVVSQYLSSNPTGSADSPNDKTSTAITGLSAGYYLVKDKNNSLSADKKDAYTRFILKVVADTSANVKSDVPTVEKKVKDINDSTDANSTNNKWQDSADYDIGDSVPFQITGTMPSNIADYTKYTYTFTDTMSAGLTYTANTAKITIGTTDVTSSFKETVTPNTDGTTTVTWACTDLKAISGVTIDASTTVVVTYNAKLNENAVIGAAGNPNYVDLTYSNNPNKGGEGNTGKTPKDTNIVFTYETIVNKLDQDKKSLAGAGFTLQKKQSDGIYKDIKTFTAGTETTFTFKGLDDGDYKLIESTTPAGYNTITPVEFTISATHTDGETPALTDLSVKVTKGSADFTVDKEAGTMSTDIVNKKGSVLPSTGGVGTHMFYVFGGCLVAAAVVLLALKKRREA